MYSVVVLVFVSNNCNRQIKVSIKAWANRLEVCDDGINCASKIAVGSILVVDISIFLSKFVRYN